MTEQQWSSIEEILKIHYKNLEFQEECFSLNHTDLEKGNLKI